MLVCHCNLITQKEIEDTIAEFLSQDEWALVTPLKVYHAMSKRGRCCGCFPNVTQIIVQVTEAWHRNKSTPEAEIVDFITILKEAHLDALKPRSRKTLAGADQQGVRRRAQSAA